jgi:hypothetical protein
VHGRITKLMLAGGFVVVVFGLVQLRNATDAAPPSASARAASPAPAAPAPEPVEAPAVTPAPPSAAGRRPAAAARPSPINPKSERAPVLNVLSGFLFKRELKRDENGKLVPIVPVQELRKDFHVTDEPMKACIARAGKRATGKATLNFTIDAKNDKLFIETTGIQDEETLAAFPDLLDCMHQTVHAMPLDRHKVPELGTPIYVRRHVQVDNGELTENTILDFSYNP